MYNHATRHLLQKCAKWKWGPNKERVFSQIRDLFLNVVLLHHPNPGLTYYLQTDSWGYGIGGVLYQDLDDRKTGVVSFASRSIRGAKLNYTTPEKELFALIFSLMIFHTYVLGTPLVIRNEHQALIFLKNCRILIERLTRWVLLLQQFDHWFEHVKETDNRIVDLLSRYPCNSSEIQTRHFAEPIIALFTACLGSIARTRKRSV